MKLVKLIKIREDLVEDEANLPEPRKELLKELNFLYEKGILTKEYED